jgi:hypothetical protein
MELIYRFEIPRMDKSITARDVFDLFCWLDIDAYSIDEYKEQDADGDFMRYVVMANRCRRGANLRTYIETQGFTEMTFRGIDWLIK